MKGGAELAEMRLQKYLARAGVASRRESERLILAGRVKVNGKLVKEMEGCTGTAHTQNR